MLMLQVFIDMQDYKILMLQIIVDMDWASKQLSERLIKLDFLDMLLNSIIVLNIVDIRHGYFRGLSHDLHNV